MKFSPYAVFSFFYSILNHSLGRCFSGNILEYSSFQVNLVTYYREVTLNLSNENFFPKKKYLAFENESNNWTWFWKISFINVEIRLNFGRYVLFICQNDAVCLETNISSGESSKYLSMVRDREYKINNLC